MEETRKTFNPLRIYCKNCGAPLKPGSKFCENCGSKA